MSELSGRLRERIAIERLDIARDELGGSGNDWAADGEVWAALTPDGRAGDQRGQAADAMPRWRVTMRPRAIGLDHRLIRGDRRMRVRAVLADPRTPDRIVIEAEEER